MLKNIKSLFILEEEKPKPPPAPKAAIETQAPATSPGEVRDEFMEILFKAMQAHNLDGFDYLEFKKSLQSLQTVPMDEPTRYRSAFAMAQTMGATPEKLLQTAQHYLDVLQQEEQKFQMAAANQQEKLVGTREQEIRQIEAAIQTKTEQIEQLTRDIEQHRQQTATLRAEITEAAAKVDTTTRNFEASYQALAGRIGTDMANIQKYLLNTAG
ncbi:MAG TPA: hypothetical protein PKC76_07245 [Saprospiraceae bacterium]|nr:hypothetical protein [Saprospiraceae bacterium]HMP23907.1 hypothetical protein [Saprospiraceae bacterium]